MVWSAGSSGGAMSCSGAAAVGVDLVRRCSSEHVIERPEFAIAS
jgi:hypothetical protein